MCFHVSVDIIAIKENKYHSIEDYTIIGEYDQYYHVSGFERPYLPVTLNTEPNIIQPAKWKLLPFWVKNEDEAKKYANTLNAESSEIFTKASYKPYIKKNRGLLWINGFFEPHSSSGSEPNDENYFIYMPNHEPFSLGIVYADWTNKDTGEVIPTFSIITTAANERMKFIHNLKSRMPLVIQEPDRERWLNDNSEESIKELMKPLPDGILADHQIYRLDTRRGADNNHPDVILPWSPPNALEQTTLF